LGRDDADRTAAYRAGEYLGETKPLEVVNGRKILRLDEEKGIAKQKEPRLKKKTCGLKLSNFWVLTAEFTIL